jgi:hypothetical protein
MRKFDLKYLYSAGAAAGLTAAAIVIPAWADSGSGQGSQSQVQRAPVPILPPPAAPGFFARGKGAGQGAAEARKHLDELTDCLRDGGVDVPHASSKGGGFSIQAPRPEARSAMQKAAKECGVPGPPPPGQLMPLSDKQREQAQKAMKSLSQCMRSKGEDLPVPPRRAPR